MWKSICPGLLGAVLLLTGCKSPFVDAVVRNNSQRTITLVEVDYPSASFGWQALEPGSERHYRFKVLGSGPATLTFVDGSGKEHRESGPLLHEGAFGSLQVTIAEQKVQWAARLKQQ